MENPYDLGYINPYYKVDEFIPYYMENNRSLDPIAQIESPRWNLPSGNFPIFNRKYESSSRIQFLASYVTLPSCTPGFFPTHKTKKKKKHQSYEPNPHCDAWHVSWGTEKTEPPKKNPRTPTDR